MQNPRVIAAVPFAKGLDLDVDPRLKPPDHLEVARNCRSTKTGALEKRYGFSRVGTNIIDTLSLVNLATEGPVRALVATDRELLAIGHCQLHAYLPAANQWATRGFVSPLVGKTREVFRGHSEYETADVARTSNYIVRAASRSETLPGGVEYVLETEVVALTGETLLPATAHATGTTLGTKPRSPKCVGLTSSVHIVYGMGSSTSPGTLKRAIFSDSSLDVTALGDVTADLYLDPTFLNTARTWDACPVTGGSVMIAYVEDSTRNVVLVLTNAAGAQTQTSSINTTGLATRCAIADSVGSNVYVFVARESGGVQTVELWIRNRATLAAVSGPHNFYTAASSAENLDNLGVAEGANLAATLRVACTWVNWRGSRDNDGGTPGNPTSLVFVNFQSCDTSGGTLDALGTAPNALGMSRPFWYRGRCYCHCIPWYKPLGFTTAHVVDTGIGYGDRAPYVAASFDVSQTITGRSAGFVGANNSVMVMSDTTEHRFMACVVLEADDENDANPRTGYDEISVRFDQPPMAAGCFPGCAVIGGGAVFWYDGQRTFELGYSAPPIIDSTTTTTAGGMLDGTYQLQNIWEFYDAQGNLHRSLPTPQFEIELSSGNMTDIDVEWRTLPFTRKPIRDMSAQFYRTGTASTIDEIPKRGNRSAEVSPNAWSVFIGTQFRHTASNIFVPLYTVGGAFENVMPEGAQLVYVAKERVCLGKFFRGSRVQWSNAISTGAVGETQLAPEFIEVLGRTIHSGDEVMGLAALRDVWVVLCQRSIYLVAGFGPDSRGAGDDFSHLTAIPADWGCLDPRSVVVLPEGVIYRSKRGFVLLNEKFQLVPIGDPVRSLTSSYTNTTSAIVVPEAMQVRFTIDNGTSGIVLVYDYRIGEWFEWRVVTTGGVQVRFISAATLDGQYYLLRDNGQVWKEDSTTYFDDTTTYVPMTLRTGWIQPGGVDTWHLLAAFYPLASRKDHHNLTIRLYTDYDEATPADSWAITAAQINALANPTKLEELIIKPRRGRKVRAFAFEIEDAAVTNPPGPAMTTGQGYSIAAMVPHVVIRGGYPKTGSSSKV